jgi:predicted membrane channel-forming protein YqfA (hemolysin III family)
MLFRTKYCDGTPTPLFRGVCHFLYTIAMIFYVPYIINVEPIKISGYMLILSSYVLSSLFHCIKFSEKNETIIRKLDHIFVHHHIFGCCCLLKRYDDIFQQVSIFFFINYAHDAEKCFKDSCDYLLTKHHLLCHVMSFLISNCLFVYSAYQGNFGDDFHLLLFGLFAYWCGQTIFVHYRKEETSCKYWSPHETFHVFLIIGSTCMLSTLH